MPLPDGLFQRLVKNADPIAAVGPDKVNGLVRAHQGPPQVHAVRRDKVDSNLELHMDLGIMENIFLRQPANVAQPVQNLPHLGGEHQHKMVPLRLGAHLTLAPHTLGQHVRHRLQQPLAAGPAIHHLVVLELGDVQIGNRIGMPSTIGLQGLFSRIQQMIQIPDVDFHVLIHELLDFPGVPDNMGCHQKHSQQKQKQNCNNAAAVVLYKLAHTGHGIDVALQHIIADRPGVDVQQGFIQNTRQGNIIAAHGHGDAVLLVQHPLDLQIVIAHLRAELILRQIAVAPYGVRLSLLHRVHAGLLGIEDQQYRILQAHCLLGLFG